MNNKTLLIIFGVLLVGYLLTRLFSGNRERSFDPDIILVDTSAADEIRLFPKAEEGREIRLARTAAGWQATMDGQTVNVPASRMLGLLGQLQEIVAKRIVSKSPDRWAEYEVDENGTRVQVFSNGKEVQDFIVGTFKFDQARRSASSYVRLQEEDPVYLVDGFLSMQFNQGFDAFRDKQLVKVNKDDVQQITLEQRGTDPVALEKMENTWYYAGMEALDSAAMASYITNISNVMGAEFADDFSAGGQSPIKEVTFIGNNLLNLEVQCYASGDSTKPFVLYSNLNPDAYFLSDSMGAYQRIFSRLEGVLEDR